jgi:hypothetical protein
MANQFIKNLKATIKSQTAKQTNEEKFDYDLRFTSIQDKFRNVSGQKNEDPTYLGFGLFPD